MILPIGVSVNTENHKIYYNSVHIMILLRTNGVQCLVNRSNLLKHRMKKLQFNEWFGSSRVRVIPAYLLIDAPRD